MHTLICDFDNTIGLEGRDVDDALSLLYLLGRHDVGLIGVTTTFGNGSIEEVYTCTQRMFGELGIGGIPLLIGAQSNRERGSEAADFLVEKAHIHEGELVILATGSPTNLFAAQMRDPGFFTRLKKIVLMGGITDTLEIGGKVLEELNFSCDPEAAYAVLSSGCPVSVVSANLCLQVLFSRERLMGLVRREDFLLSRYFGERVLPWLCFVEEKFGTDGFHPWDLIAAVYVTDPGLFRVRSIRLDSRIDDLRRGELREVGNAGGRGYGIDLIEEVVDLEIMWDTVLSGWENVKVR